MAFWATCKIAQPIQPIWQHIFVLPWSALKKPPWEFNFFHNFGIPSSSRHEKRCQMLQTLFWLFQCSKNPRCKVSFWNLDETVSTLFQFYPAQIVSDKTHFIQILSKLYINRLWFRVPHGLFGAFIRHYTSRPLVLPYLRSLRPHKWLHLASTSTYWVSQGPPYIWTEHSNCQIHSMYGVTSLVWSDSDQAR